MLVTYVIVVLLTLGYPPGFLVIQDLGKKTEMAVWQLNGFFGGGCLFLQIMSHISLSDFVGRSWLAYP